MKKLSAVFMIVTLLLVFAVQPTFAASRVVSTQIEVLDDGSRYVTVIEDVSSTGIHILSKDTVTKSKTTYYQNSAGQNLWYVKVTATFTYGDGSAKCTSVTPSAASLSTAWKVSDISGAKSGNQASATATGTQYVNGIVSTKSTKTVTLTCSATGVFS